MDIPRGPRSALYSRLKSNSTLRRTALGAATGYRTLTASLRRFGNPRYSPPPLAEVESVDDWLLRDVKANGAAAPGIVHPGLPGYRVHNSMPRSIDHGFDSQYKPLSADVPPSFVVEMHDAHAAGDGVVISGDGVIIRQLSRAIGSLNAYMSGDPYAEEKHFQDARSHVAFPPRRLRGTSVLLSTFAGRGYFHWLFDVIARLATLDDAGIDSTAVDHYIVNNYVAPYQVDILRDLGIDRPKIVTSFRYPHIVAERLLVPSLSRENGVMPDRACQFIRGAFQPEPLPSDLTRVTKVYISRAGTDHGHLAGESHTLGMLRNRGFTPVHLESLSMGQKATLFSQAEAVIGASGAGLTNLVFCTEGTVVIDICTRGYAVLDAWDLSNRIGCEYWYSTPSPEGIEGVIDASGLT